MQKACTQKGNQTIADYPSRIACYALIIKSGIFVRLIMKIKPKTKCLTYAYATSPDAEKHNKGRGCYMVEAPNVLAIFQDYQKFMALDYFENLNYPIDLTKSFTRHHITFSDGQLEPLPSSAQYPL